MRHPIKLIRSLFVSIALSSVSTLALAVPVTYDINFTLVNGIGLPTNGSFVYDSALANPFSAFSVTWASRNFDFTAVANAPSRIGSCGPADTTFGLMSLALGCVGQGGIYRWVGQVNDLGSPQYRFGFGGTDASFTNGVGIEVQQTTNLIPDQPRFFQGSGTFAITARNVPSVPEPGTLALMGLGVLAIAAVGTRRRSRASRDKSSPPR